MFSALFLLSLLTQVPTITPNYAQGRCGSQGLNQVYFMILGQTGFPTCLEKGPYLKVSMFGGRPMVDVDREKFQVKLIPNFYFGLTTTLGTQQIVPGTYFTKLLKVMDAVPPVVAGAVCGVIPPENESQLTYQFGRTGSIILDENFMYVCTPANKWKKIKLEEIAQ